MQECERQTAYEFACAARDQLKNALTQLALHDNTIIIKPSCYDLLNSLERCLHNWIENEFLDAAEEGQTLREIPVVLPEDDDQQPATP